MLQKSATWDETHYLGGGNYILKTLRWDIWDARLHPVFWTVWHDLPLLAVSIPEQVWREPYGVNRGQKIMALRPDDSLLNRCRFMSLPFALLLGWLLFRWSRQLYGDLGGLFSLAFFCFCPNVLANAPLVTPDVTFGCFVFFGAHRLWRLAQRPCRRNLFLGGLALALMLLSKHTALLLLPIFFVTDVSYRLAAGQIEWHSPRGLWQGLRHWPALLGAGFLVLWAGYGFQVGAWTLPSGLVVPLPAPAYFSGAVYQFMQSQGPHPSFLMGMYSPTGWWYYYGVVCLVKLPVPILVLAAGLALARRRPGMHWRLDEIYLVVPLILFLVYLSIFNSIQNGFRYLLAVYPLFLVLLGKYGEVLSRRLWGRLVGGGLMLWMVAAAVWTWPNYLAYFNDISGGAREGYHWLADSNLDWGQDLKALKKFMDARGIKRIRLSYFGTADPAHYGIAYEYLPSVDSGLRPTPDLPAGESPSRFVALSTYEYQGVNSGTKDIYKGFYHYVANQIIGGSILVYDLNALIPRTRPPLPLRICTLGGSPDPVDACP